MIMRRLTAFASDDSSVRSIIFRSRLISAVLFLVAVICFAIMLMLSGSDQPQPPAPAKQVVGILPPEKNKAPATSAPATLETATKSGAAALQPAQPITAAEATEQLKARFTTPDYFDPALYVALSTLNARLATLPGAESEAIQKQLGSLVDLEKRLTPVRGLSQTVNRELELLLSKGGPLFKGIIPSASPFVGISEPLEKLRADFLAIQAKKPIDSLKAFQVSLKALIEARDKLNDPKLAPEMNDRRKAIVARIDALTVMKRAKDWESATFAAVAISSEINRLSNTLTAAPVAATTDMPEIGISREMISRLFGVLGLIALVLSILEIARCDRRLLHGVSVTNMDSAITNSNRYDALQRANEGLPYLQLAAKQVSELGVQLIATIKKLGATVSSMEMPKAGAAEQQELKVLVDTQYRAREILKSFAVMKEQSIRLSLAIAQTNAETAVTDLSDRLSDSIEHVESITRQLQQELDVAVAAQMTVDRTSLPADAVGLKRDAEGLLMVASQWSRHFDRLNDALTDLDQLLTVASTTGPKSDLGSDRFSDSSAKREPA
ncbi:MAG: hypothetical protein RJA58_233 [Pseudomonadota bacterium]|jgi:hypothetical protein